MFHLDDIILRVAEELVFGPYLFKIGPRHTQIFEPYKYLFFADYPDKCRGPSLLNVTDLLFAYGKPFFGPNVVPTFEAALYNAGFSH